MRCSCVAMLPSDWALAGGVLFGLIRGTTILIIGLGGKTVGEVEHRYDAVRSQKGLAQLGSTAGVALAMA